MTAAALRILEELRGLPPEDRLRVVEQVVREVAAEVTAQHTPMPTAIWSDEPESDFQAYQSAVACLRATDIWRTGDEQDPA